ncbi:UNVERIFIED_CONTAM: hypothetical protein GTU68_036965 [Idotea baltica]
MGRSM